MSDVLKVLSDLIKKKHKGKHWAESVNYIMSNEDLIMLLAAVDKTMDENIQDNQMKEMIARISLLEIGYYLGLNKQKEVS